jgi:microcystin degradation protein MlrC
MRVFAASLATETNTFSPIPTDFAAFSESFYAPPGQHPETPTLCSAPMVVARRRAHAEGFTLIEGTAAWAEPAGIVNRATYERLRDEILGQLRAALPVDVVILGLHGAMVAHGYDDCEGDLLAGVRAIVGPKVVIAAEFDPHCHLSALRVKNGDIFVMFKEVPHIDFADRAEEVVDLALRMAKGEIRPHMAIYDCRMLDMLPTSKQPMRGFVDRIKALEGKDGVLSISVIHGFSAADVADVGIKILVITDNQPEKGAALAARLGHELFALRGTTGHQMLGIDAAIDAALAVEGGPVVLADVWDNPGGGTAGDATTVLARFLERGIRNTAFGTIWDPMAVKLCIAAGEGATLPLRFGGKAAPHSGRPLDAEVTITKVVRGAVQHFRDSIVPLGDSAAIRLAGIDVILNSNRAQAFEPDLFSNLGIDPLVRKMLIVKSANHFYGAFSKIAKKVIYIDAGGPYPGDPLKVHYRKITRPIWPLDQDPHGDGIGAVSGARAPDTFE